MTDAIRINAPAAGTAPQGGAFNLFYVVALGGFLAIAFGEGWSAIDSHMGEILLFALNGVLSIAGQVMAINRRASIHYVSFVFCYLFMAVTPLIQLGDGDDPVFFMGSVIGRAAIMAFAFTCIGLHAVRGFAPVEAPPAEPSAVARRRDPGLLPLFLLSAVVTVFTLALYNKALFTNREQFAATQVELFGDIQTAQILSTLFLSMPFYAATMGLRTAWAARRTNWLLLFGVVMVGACIIENPLVNARFVLAGYAFFFIDYMSRGRGMKLLAALLMAGVLLAPAFQAFRSDNGGDAVELSDNVNSFNETFLSYDYDAFQTMSYTIVNVDETGIKWGSNILGAVLFFVPRALWSGKPEPTSHYIYDTMVGYRFIGTNNLSTPLFAEGYYAFWWFGALLISWIYWRLVTRLSRRAAHDPDSLAFAFKCVCVGLTLIFLRGTLMIGIAALGGAFISILVPWMALAFARHPRARARPLG